MSISKGARVSDLCLRAGLNIAKARSARGWSQNELGARARSSGREICRIEAGTQPRGPTLATLAKIAGALGIDPAELLREDDGREP